MSVPFDLNGWLYDDPLCLQRLCDMVYSMWAEDMRKLIGQGGGKEFGLNVCASIARCNGFKNLVLPPWIAIDPALMSEIAIKELVENWRSCYSEKLAGSYLIIRSSGKGEDWRDPSSGSHKSFENFSHELNPDAVQYMIDNKLSFIVQAYIRGVGLVIDIGYSHLYEAPVARISHGRYSQREDGSYYKFSNPTSDIKAKAGVYLESGWPVIEFNDTLFKDLGPLMANKLFSALREAKIEFGVQFEIIIEPENPLTWHLVQVRPSPGMLRGIKSRPKTRGTLLCRTAKINRWGSCQGRLESLSLKDEGLVALLSLSVDTGDYSETSDFFGGKIIFCDDASKASKELYKIVYALGMCGAGGIIFCHDVVSNFVHNFTSFGSEADRVREISKKCLIQKIPHDASKFIKNIVRSDPDKEFLMANDGLIGELYILS